MSLYAVTWFFRVAVLAGPVLAFMVTERMCLGLARRDRDEAEHGRETGRIVMSPEGATRRYASRYGRWQGRGGNWKGHWVVRDGG